MKLTKHYAQLTEHNYGIDVPTKLSVGATVAFTDALLKPALEIV
jgi:hypothetical protein